MRSFWCQWSQNKKFFQERSNALNVVEILTKIMKDNFLDFVILQSLVALAWSVLEWKVEAEDNLQLSKWRQLLKCLTEREE